MAAKIMLVEDDTNLSDIYKARLEAEGFQIITAVDGEAALALAVKEHPDLIISDVMMPKISGFDMLDILRSTDGIKTTKVIMMTALSQAEDKTRADKLGADRYLVKSQVTLEDVVRTVHEVLNEDGTTAAAPAIDDATAPVPDQPPVDSTTAQPGSVPAATDDNPADSPAPVDPTVTKVPVMTPPDDDQPAPASDQNQSEVSRASEQPNDGSSQTNGKSEALSKIQEFVKKQESSDKTAGQDAGAPAGGGTAKNEDSGEEDDQDTAPKKKVIEPLVDAAKTSSGDTLLKALSEEENKPNGETANGQGGSVITPASSDPQTSGTNSEKTAL